MSTPPESFVDLVRDALLNLYDLTALQTHPLLSLAGGAARGRVLRQTVRDAVNALCPAAVDGAWRARRSYRILELRYLEGQDVGSVMDQVALSKAQYHREHARALQAVAALLWEQWDLDGRWPLATESGQDQMRQEAEHLVQRHGAGPIDVVDLVQGVIRVLTPLCVAHGTELRLIQPMAVPAIVGERVGLRQALVSLLAPAITASETGTVTLRLFQEAGQVVIEGRGRAADVAALVGRPGLADGLPFITAQRGALAYHPPSPSDAAWIIRLHFPASERPTLLVVDDNTDFIRLIDRTLIAHGWHVVGVEEAGGACLRAAQLQPQAILLDVVLPDRDGWEVLMTLKAQPSTRAIPVIVCSVLNEPEVAQSLGGAGYIHKPIDERALVDALIPIR